MGNDKFEIDNAPKEKKKNTWYIILIILLLVTNAIFIYLYFSSQNKFQTAVVEKERTLQETYQLKYELDSIMREYDKIKEEYGILNIKLSDQDSLIKEQAKEIEKLIASQADYTRIKRQLDRLRNITQSYVRQIDSLYRINQELTVENVKLKEDLTYEKTKAIELSTITDSLSKTISEATYMVAYNITPIAYKIRGNKATPTDKAKRTDKFDICFTIGENKLVPTGEYTLYIRIARPDGLILTQGGYSFDYQGRNLQFSEKTIINYTGKAQKVCVDYARDNLNLIPGIYYFSVFTNDYILGEGSLKLE
jgi:flagellar basal body-associated protein FliL